MQISRHLLFWVNFPNGSATWAAPVDSLRNHAWHKTPFLRDSSSSARRAGNRPTEKYKHLCFNGEVISPVRTKVLIRGVFGSLWVMPIGGANIASIAWGWLCHDLCFVQVWWCSRLFGGYFARASFLWEEKAIFSSGISYFPWCCHRHFDSLLTTRMASYCFSRLDVNCCQLFCSSEL